MFIQMFPVGAVRLHALGAGVLLASTLIALGAEKRVDLGADVLARLRGSNPDLVLTQNSCNAYNFDPCTVPRSACTACTQATYTSVIGGLYGGYDPPTESGLGCGFAQLGICTVNLVCMIVPPDQFDCHQPDSPTVQ